MEQLCELGAQQLMRTDYLAAIETLTRAEQIAWERQDFDTLSRIHMPLQEAHRQSRLQSLEQAVAIELAEGPAVAIDAGETVRRYPQGQLLIGGWGTLAPAIAARQVARQRRCNAEVFLAAVFPLHDSSVVVIAPTEDATLPPPLPRSREQLAALLPPHALMLDRAMLPIPESPPTPALQQFVLELWAQLHRPFLAAAEAQTHLLEKLRRYRDTLRVDPACELAHQNLSIAAMELVRERARG